MSHLARKYLDGRNIAILLAVLALIIAGTWGAVRYATDRLLYASATASAQEWAGLLAESLDDLEQIAAGVLPTRQSEIFFDWAKKAGGVFRYEIYNRQGYSQLVSDESISLVDISDYSEDAVRALEERIPVVDVFEGDGEARPLFYSRAFVPAFQGSTPVAIIAAYVDQTDQRALLTQTLAYLSVILCVLTGLAFLLPAIAWYRRSKEKRKADQRVWFLAHHDALTGLINRARLAELLDHQLAAPAGIPAQAAVHFIDLDRFKEVNDTHGHAAGDTVLTTVAQRLLSESRDTDLVSRLGGDEFVIIQTNVADSHAAKSFAERVANAVAAPITLVDGQEVSSGASIGVALAPADGVDSERLLRSADLALYAAKEAGRNCVRFFDPAMDEQLRERIRLEARIREAIRNDGFELHYQPMFEMPSRSVIGFEALVRLPKEDGTLIPPAVFIPVAEEMRVIDKVGEWVLRTACMAASTWPGDLRIAVNLSPAQFEAGSVSETVAAALRESGIAPERLELEVTESLLLRDSESVIQDLNRIKQLGVSIVMDDFGTGYSSLSYLWRFNFDKIKIDRSFMQALKGTGRDTEQIVRTIIALGRELDMHVTVEGVENSYQASFLSEANAEQVQGFYFGKPIPGGQVANAIRTFGADSLPAAASAC